MASQSFLIGIACCLVLMATELASPAGASAKQSVMMDVTEYGARPNDGLDDTDGVMVAVDAARDADGPATVLFPPGLYHFDGFSGAARHLTISDVHDLVLLGAGAELIFRNPSMGGICLENSVDCTIKGFRVDYETPPFTQGIVKAVDTREGSVDFEVDPGFPSLDSEWFYTEQMWGSVWHRATRRLREDAPDHFFPQEWTEVTQPGDERAMFRVLMKDSYKSGVRFIQPGDAMVFVARQGGGAVDAVLSQRILIEDVTIHASSTLAVTLYAASECAVRRLTVGVRPGSNRIISTNADGVHTQQARRGPVIEDCSFSSMMDDAITIYTVPNLVREVLSDTELVVSGGCLMQAGDVLEAWDPIRGFLRGRSAIKCLEQAGGMYTVTLETPISGLVAGNDYRSSDHLYNRSACGEGFTIRNNKMRDHRRHGIYIKSGNGVIENNSISNVSGLGIVIANEPTWPEGPISRGIVVRNNTIESVGYPGSYGLQPDAAAIQVKATTLSGKISQFRHEDITLQNNSISDWPRNAIYLGGVHGANITGNKVSMGHQPRYAGKSHSPLYVEQSDNVRVDGLLVEDTRPIFAPVYLTRTVEKATTTVRGVTKNGEAGPELVRDLSR